jgi:dolichol-phosphate mannosyltransferase
MDLSIIIPCFNEEENVSKIQRELLPVVFELAQSRTLEIIFIDDGSSDNTWQALNETFGNGASPNLVFRFEQHEVNRGLGAAIRTGFATAHGNVIVTTDSDGTYKFNTIPDLLSYLQPNIDIVTASPYHPAGQVVGVPAYRLILSRGSSSIYRILVDWQIRTYTCLFRAYRRQVIESVSFESNGYLAGTELMISAMLKGFKVAEYPAVLYSRVLGASKAKLMRTVLAHLGFQWRVLLHRLKVVPFVTANETVGRQKWA